MSPQYAATVQGTEFATSRETSPSPSLNSQFLEEEAVGYYALEGSEVAEVLKPARLSPVPRCTCPPGTRPGATIWLTGLPSAGKTTIASELAGRLREEGQRVEVLDGDKVRTFLSAGLGFSREDRHTNVQRIGWAAEVLARNGVLAVVPVIAPYADSREAVRKRHQASRVPFLEVHVATPVEVCSVRDVKGLYAKQAAGEISGLTGVDDPYEAPENPDLRIESQNQTVQESTAQLHALLTERGLL